MDIYLMGVDILWRRKDREVGADIYLLGVDVLWRRTDRDLDAMTVTTMRARSEYVMVCQSRRTPNLPWSMTQTAKSSTVPLEDFSVLGSLLVLSYRSTENVVASRGFVVISPL